MNRFSFGANNPSRFFQSLFGGPPQPPTPDENPFAVSPLTLSQGVQPPTSPFDGSPQPPAAPQPQPSLIDAYKELINRPDGPAMSAYSKFLSQGVPQREDYKPGKMTKLGAILSGLAAGYQSGPKEGIELGRSILDRPYEMALHKNEMQGSRLGKAASLEELGQKGKVEDVKLLGDLSNKKSDNDRADLLANDLIKTRAITRQEAEQRMKNAGLFHEVNKVTGNLELIKPDGSRVIIGKFDQNTGEKVAEKQKEITLSSNLTSGREAARDNRILTREQTMEATRQSNRKELSNVTLEAQIKRDAARAKLTNSNSVLNTIRQNRQNVEATVAANPEKYQDVWVDSPDGKTQELTVKAPAAGTPARQAYDELYNLLYAGATKADGSTVGGFVVGKRK